MVNSACPSLSPSHKGSFLQFSVTEKKKIYFQSLHTSEKKKKGRKQEGE